MRSWLTGTMALVGLTLREAQRQRLWVLFLVGMAVLIVAAPSLKAVADADRLKLAIVAQSGVVGFVAVLLAILLPAAVVRRDLESRTGFMLFSKPLARSAYLLGRWGGVQMVLLVGTLLLCVVGTATIGWQFNGMPPVRGVMSPSSWEQVSMVGQVQPIAAERRHLALAGISGNGVRWRFTGLPADRDMELLIKVRLVGGDDIVPLADVLVRVEAEAPGGTRRVLEVDPGSPYGLMRGSTAIAAGQAVVRSREAGRTDLAVDYLRLRLPRTCVIDGTTVVQLTRMEPAGQIVAQRDGSCLVAVPGGMFFGNLVRGACMQLAGAALLAAWALLIACVAGLGVALMGGLTLFLGGAALPAVREVLEYRDSSLPMRRIMELIVSIFPDFDRFGAAPTLAAGQEVPWSLVADAWLHASIYILLFLGVAWWTLRRREL